MSNTEPSENLKIECVGVDTKVGDDAFMNEEGVEVGFRVIQNAQSNNERLLECPSGDVP